MADEQIQNQTPAPKGSSGWIVGIVILVILLGGFLWWRSQGASTSLRSESQETGKDVDNDGDEMAPSTSPTPAEMTSPTPSPTDTSASSTQAGSTSGSVKTFTVEGSNFKFAPSQITVKKGDTVKITFSNVGGFHDFVIDEFNVKTDRIGSGQTATVQFVADKTGSFEFYCSVGEHRAMGMKGTLVVQ